MKLKILLISFLVNLFFSLNAYDWQVNKTVDLIIHSSYRDNKIAIEIGNKLQQRIDAFQMSLGVYTNKRANIFIAPNSYFYDKWTSKKEGIIEHSNAFYSKRTRAIYIRPIAESKIYGNHITILLHEYIHFFIHQHWNNPLLWFDEGMAQYFSEGLSFAKEMRLVKDQFLNITLPLKKMYRYPKKRIYWEPFYSKSAKGVAYMFHSKKKQFQHFWDLSEKSHDFRKTFVMAFGITPEQFSNEFEKTLSKKTRTKALLFSLGFTWSLLPFLALIVWGIKKFKNKIITDKWAEEDE